MKRIPRGFEVEQGIGDGIPLPVGNDGTGKACGKIPPVDVIPGKIGVHDPRPLGVGQKFIPITDQRPCRDGKLHAYPPGSVVDQVDHPSFSDGKLFRDHAHVILTAVHEKMFHRLQFPFAVIFEDNFRTSHAEFKPFPPHGFNQDCQLELTAPLDHEPVAGIAVFHVNGNVHQCFLDEAFPYLCGLDVFPLPAAERRVADGKRHGNGRFVHVDSRQGLGVIGIADRVTDMDILDPRQYDDFTGPGGFHRLQRIPL
jgi:hypothetical protein